MTWFLAENQNSIEVTVEVFAFIETSRYGERGNSTSFTIAAN
jgi:hypothetical protein